MSTGKSKMACRWSIDKLLKGRRFAYLWTFTTPDACDVREVSARWRAFLRLVKKRKFQFVGVRVFEIHPGGHGAHVHFISRSWYDVRQVRKMAATCGFGRIHAKAIPTSSAGYIAKYLTKQNAFYEQDKKLLRGVRLWSAYGCSSFHFVVRVRDVHCNSRASRLYRRLLGLTGSPYGDFCVADAISRGLPVYVQKIATGLYNLAVGGPGCGYSFSRNFDVGGEA